MKKWKSIAVLFCFLICPLTANAGIVTLTGMTVSPTPLTTSDFLIAEIDGFYSSTGFTLNGDPLLSITGNLLVIDFSTTQPVAGLTILDYFSYPVDIGFLSEGDYFMQANFYVDGFWEDSMVGSFSVSAVPVPATAWLLLSGFLPLFTLSRNKTKA